MYKLPKYIIKWIIKYHCLGLSKNEKILKRKELRSYSQNDFIFFIPHPDQISCLLYKYDYEKYKKWFKSNYVYLFDQDASDYMLPSWSYCRQQL